MAGTPTTTVVVLGVVCGALVVTTVYLAMQAKDKEAKLQTLRTKQCPACVCPQHPWDTCKAKWMESLPLIDGYFRGKAANARPLQTIARIVPTKLPTLWGAAVHALCAMDMHILPHTLVRTDRIYAVLLCSAFVVGARQALARPVGWETQGAMRKMVPATDGTAELAELFNVAQFQVDFSREINELAQVIFIMEQRHNLCS